MKVVITKANSDTYEKYVEMNTMDELERFIKRVKHDVIVSIDPQVYEEAFNEEAVLRLNIYNDYVE